MAIARANLLGVGVSAIDYDLATASVLIAGVLVAVGSLLADILVAYSDPRIRNA